MKSSKKYDNIFDAPVTESKPSDDLFDYLNRLGGNWGKEITKDILNIQTYTILDQKERNKIITKCEFCSLSGFTLQELECHKKICSKSPKLNDENPPHINENKYLEEPKEITNSNDISLEINPRNRNEVSSNLETIWEESETKKDLKTFVNAGTKVEMHGITKNELETSKSEDSPQKSLKEESENILYVSEMVNMINNSLNGLRNRMLMLEERLNQIGLQFNIHISRIRQNRERQAKKLHEIEMTIGIKGDEMHFKCCLLESQVNILKDEFKLPLIKFEHSPNSTIFPVKSNVNQWQLILKKLFPDEKYGCYKRLKWCTDNYSGRKSRGFCLEKWFHCKADEYDYRCYLYPGEDSQHVDARIWLDKDKKPHMVWPPEIRVVLGILDPTYEDEDHLMYYKSLEYPEGFREVYPNWSGVYLFSKFISFWELEDPYSGYTKNDKLHLVIYFLS